MAKIMFIIEMLVIEENSVLIIYLTSWDCEIFSNLKERKKNPTDYLQIKKWCFNWMSWQ